MMRATVDDPEMARGVGINVFRISMGVFAMGALLASVAGVVAGGFVGVYPGADFEILPYAFVVVIVGGMGSLKGALVGSLARRTPRQLRQGAVPRAQLLHAVCADGDHPRRPADRPLRARVMTLGAAGHWPRGRDRGRPDPARRSAVPGAVHAVAGHAGADLGHARDEPRPPPRLHRPLVARARRLPRPRRLQRRHPHHAPRRELLGDARGRDRCSPRSARRSSASSRSAPPACTSS